ncbi:hypothetical protein M0804_007111 [Polistes exclamans]|nr:hypothetical protein M0804_007111 [Polistes exclamans]
MKEEEYLNEMHKMLQNKDIYQLLNKDPTSRFEKLANNLIMKLRKESIITEEIEKSMKSYNSVAPKIYGQRKTHKQSLALRPVLYWSNETEIKKRLDQHKNDCKPINVNKTNTTALAEHHLKTGHTFKFDAATILDLEENWYKRNISETYHICNNNTLPNKVQKILNLVQGLGILIKPKEVQVNTLIKDLEYGIKNLTIENGDKKTIKNAKNNVRTKANPDIIVTRLDKGNNTVIIKKDEYLKEMEKLLKDTNTYSLLNNDPTNKFEKMDNNLITKLRNE